MMKPAEKRPLIPKRRFPEFQDAGQWEERTLDAIALFYKGKGVSKAEIDPNGETPCIRYGELYTIYGEVISDVVSKTSLHPSDLFLSRSNDILIPSSGETKVDIAKASCVLLDNVALGGDLNVLRSDVNGIFLSYLLNGSCKSQIAKKAQGDAVVHLYASQLKLLTVTIPKPAEQQKLADCLASIDELITLEAQQLDALKTHKNGLMQQLFPPNDESQPKLRFAEFRDAGEWEIQPLSLLARRSLQKNSHGKLKRVLTNSAEFGVVNQRDYFDKDIATQGRLESYSVVEIGDLVYNPRISASAQVGPISKNNIATGVMSPLYTIFRFHNNDNDFYAYYFKTTGWHQYLRQVSSTGARHDRMAITNDAFMAMPLPVTSTLEQQKISSCLASLDDLIIAQDQKLDMLKTFKKGLMQQLFPVMDEAK